MSDDVLFIAAINDHGRYPARKFDHSTFNPVRWEDGCVIMTVKHGDRAFDCKIDVLDYFKIKDLSWRTDEDGYASTDCGKKIYMHRLLFELVGFNLKSYEIDHKNNNRLDNRSQNLRVVLKVKNCWNSLKRSTGTSKYKGVYYDKERNKFCCRFSYNGKVIHQKRYTSEIEAVLRYNELARQYHGEYAKLNIIDHV